MSAWAKPGVKCVCVMPKPAGQRSDAIYPVVGQTYTIRAVKPAGYGGLTEPILMLEEISNAHIKPEPFEPGFTLRGFRPLVSRTQEQDLEHFLPLLKTKEMV